MLNSCTNPPIWRIENSLHEAIRNYRGLTPAQAETLARARVSVAISQISNGGELTARKAELRFLEVQLAYELLRRT